MRRRRFDAIARRGGLGDRLIMRESSLPSYLERIGFQGVPAADLETLHRLQRAHRLAVPFENLDIPLGRGISLDGEAVFDKLVRRRRGGYCFEQNGLLLAMLREIGFAARPLLARVWLLANGIPPRTHTFSLVTIDGEDFLADAGFGGSFLPVMRLADGAVVETSDRARHRLLRDGDDWTLERDGGSGWARQYSFSLATVEPADLEMGNHWTSTRPNTRFTTLRIASLALPDGYASLVERTLTVSRLGEARVEEIGDAARYREVLAETFRLALSAEEVGKLGLY